MGSGGSSAPQPNVITPGQAAQASVGTAAAGEMMSVANQPIEQYANLATTGELGPAEQQTQQALAGQSAMQGAQQQQAVQSAVDPLAYAQRQMRLKSATDRLGQLYSQNPSAFSFSAPGAFSVPGTAALPALDALRNQGTAIASNLSTASVDQSGGNPQLQTPNKAKLPALVPSTSYLT